MTNFQDDHHLAAAIAAAAEIARTGGMFHADLAPNKVPASPMFHSATELLGRVSPSSSTGHDDEDVIDEHDDNDDDDEGHEDSGSRISRSRERNREHARRTRLRKKAQLEALQSKVKGLKAESEVLQQSLEECSLASILVNLSQANQNSPKQEKDKIAASLIHIASTSETCSNQAEEIVQMVGGKRKRFSAPDMDDAKTSQLPLRIKMNGRWTYIGGGKSHINWKTGVYTDGDGVRKQLTQQQLECLRRERNRMHAKMTRDRKKNFIATIEKTIEDLESNNTRMKQVLAKVVTTHFPNNSFPPQTSVAAYKLSAVTPELSSKVAPAEPIPPLDHIEILPSPSKKHCQGIA